MKLGILTFHSQLNYGGVLQCWALKTVLERMGHEVQVVDRWLTPDNRLLEGPFGHAGLKGWLNILVHVALGCGQLGYVLRHWRTLRFVRSLNLTPYHFHQWTDLPLRTLDLNLDGIVVGSDQVWHGGEWGDPRPYLLEGAPPVTAIAYAASFGTKSLPDGYDYSAGFRRFKAISVREAEGRRLVESLGFAATHVVDPTLLLGASEWQQKMGAWRKVPRRVVCYFLAQDIPDAVRVLDPWARQNDCSVEIFCDGALINDFPRTMQAAASRFGKMLRKAFAPSRVRVCAGCGPREFVKAFAQAEMCITDSFHAVMFSAIFSCNLRVLRPQNPARKEMFARIDEFVTSIVEGSPFAGTLASALVSLSYDSPISFDRTRLSVRCTKSLEWLLQALRLVATNSNGGV